MEDKNLDRAKLAYIAALFTPFGYGGRFPNLDISPKHAER